MTVYATVPSADSSIRVLVTGGAGFIGSAVVRRLLQVPDVAVLNVDQLTYAGNLDSVADVASHPRYRFAHADIADAARLRAVFADFQPSAVLHLAAESHVDRSIDGPAVFMQTNVIGTFTLLDVAYQYWKALPPAAAGRFRFIHVSTDEVFGSLDSDGAFTEETAYRPSSPYAASKAAADHLATAWAHTYGLPVIVTNCCNNYGPRQFPEKLIPLVILAGLAGKPLPVYGTGENVRDWLFVDDHAEALFQVLTRGRAGASYLIGGGAERRNLDVVRDVCRLLDELAPDLNLAPRERLITFVEDRPGHDHRYAIDARKIQAELGWAPREDFASGLRKTVRWYLDHRSWWERVLSGAYRGERLGLGGTR